MKKNLRYRFLKFQDNIFRNALAMLGAGVIVSCTSDNQKKEIDAYKDSLAGLKEQFNRNALSYEKMEVQKKSETDSLIILYKDSLSVAGQKKVTWKNRIIEPPKYGTPIYKNNVEKYGTPVPEEIN